jgi:hypothetical protein
MDILFQEEGHVYTHDGEIWPSSTQIINAQSEWFTPEAALRGTHKHLAIDLHRKSDLDEDSLDQEYLQSVEAYKRFVAETGFIVMQTEVMAHSHTHRFACRVDKIGQFPTDSVPAIVEIKTGAYPEWCCLQTAAQALCLEGFHKRYGLHLYEDKYKLHPHTNRTDAQEFLTLLASKRIREKYKI